MIMNSICYEMSMNTIWKRTLFGITIYECQNLGMDQKLLSKSTTKVFQNIKANNCQAPGPGPGLDHWSLAWSTWSPTWPNLA